jgi:hypothetical protein
MTNKTGNAMLLRYSSTLRYGSGYDIASGSANGIMNGSADGRITSISQDSP